MRQIAKGEKRWIEMKKTEKKEEYFSMDYSDLKGCYSS